MTSSLRRACHRISAQRDSLEAGKHANLVLLEIAPGTLWGSFVHWQIREVGICGVQVGPHRLRHTFASQMLNAGMPVTSLQRFLGRENLDTTMGNAEVSDPLLQKEYNQAIRKMDPLWQLDEYESKLQLALHCGCNFSLPP